MEFFRCSCIKANSERVSNEACLSTILISTGALFCVVLAALATDSLTAEVTSGLFDLLSQPVIAKTITANIELRTSAGKSAGKEFLLIVTLIRNI
jgi:hypothetical protein